MRQQLRSRIEVTEGQNQWAFLSNKATYFTMGLLASAIANATTPFTALGTATTSSVATALASLASIAYLWRKNEEVRAQIEKLVDNNEQLRTQARRLIEGIDIKVIEPKFPLTYRKIGQSPNDDQRDWLRISFTTSCFLTTFFLTSILVINNSSDEVDFTFLRVLSFLFGVTAILCVLPHIPAAQNLRHYHSALTSETNALQTELTDARIANVQQESEANKARAEKAEAENVSITKKAAALHWHLLFSKLQLSHEQQNCRILRVKNASIHHTVTQELADQIQQAEFRCQETRQQVSERAISLRKTVQELIVDQLQIRQAVEKLPALFKTQLTEARQSLQTSGFIPK